MAIAGGVLVKVVLMVFLGTIEVAQWLDLDAHRQSVLLGLFCNDFVNYGAVGRVAVVDTCAVARTFVLALFVKAGGVDSLEIHLKQETQAYNSRIVAQMHRLGIARLVGIDLFICGILGVAVGKAYLGKGNAFNKF